MILHDSDALTKAEADAIIAEYPEHEVVYVHGDTIVWREQVVVFPNTDNPFQLDGHLDTIGVPNKRIVLNMANERTFS